MESEPPSVVSTSMSSRSLSDLPAETNEEHTRSAAIDRLSRGKEALAMDVTDRSKPFPFVVPEVDIPQFDGKQPSFKIWLRLFRVFASLHGFLDALERKDRIPQFKVKSDAELVSAGYSRKEVLQARHAYVALRSSSEDEIFKGIVQTGNGPNDAYAALVEHFTPPRSVGNIAALMREVSNLKLCKGQNPGELLMEFVRISGELEDMGSPLTNRAILAFYFEALPEEYQFEVRTLKARGEESRQTVLSAMMSRWWSLQRESENQSVSSRQRRKSGKGVGLHGARNGSEREVSMSEEQLSGAGDCRKVNELCTNCDMAGRNRRRFPKCHKCGSRAHVDEVCQSEGQNVCPGDNPECQGWVARSTFRTTKKDRHAVAVETWYTYSGGKYHVTFSPRGMYDFKPCDPGTEISLSLGSVPVVGFGKLDVHLETDTWKGCCRATLFDVALAPCIDRHWFSLISAVEKGYKVEISNGACHLVKANSQGAVEEHVIFSRTQGLYGAAGYRLNPPVAATSAMALRGKVLDINYFHCSYGHVQDEESLRVAAAQLDVGLSGELWPCTGCSEARAILGDTSLTSMPVKPRAVRKLYRVFIDIGRRKEVQSLGGSHFAMTICDEYTGYLWVYFLARQADVSVSFSRFLADVRKEGEVGIVVTHDSRLFGKKAFWDVCTEHRVRREFSPAHDAIFSRASHRGLDALERASHAAIAQAPQLFRDVELPDSRDLWAEAMAWAREALNRIPLSTGSSRKSPYKRWHGDVAPTRLLPFLTPGFYTPAEQTRAPHPPRSIPCFYLWSGCRPMEHMRVLDPSSSVVQISRASFCGPQTPMIEACPPPAVKLRTEP